MKVNLGRFGRGIFSNGTIEKGEILMRIESDWMISTSFAIEQLYRRIPMSPTTSDIKLDCFDTLMMLLVLEGIALESWFWR